MGDISIIHRITAIYSPTLKRPSRILCKASNWCRIEARMEVFIMPKKNPEREVSVK